MRSKNWKNWGHKNWDLTHYCPEISGKRQNWAAGSPVSSFSNCSPSSSVSGLTSVPRVLLGMLAYGAGLELAQWAVGWRFAEWADLAADAVGVGLAWLCVAGWRRRV